MGEWQGQQVLGVRLTGTNATLRWHRSTVLGLALKLDCKNYSAVQKI